MSKQQVLSPLPGTFYRRSAPDQPPFKADGAAVKAADVIGLIEVMKNFHEVTADFDGRAIHFILPDGDPIMAGQVIAEIEM